LFGLSPEAIFRKVAGDQIAIIDNPDEIRDALHR